MATERRPASWTIAQLAYLMAMTAVILALGGECLLRWRLRASEGAAEAFRARHPNVFEARVADEAWAKGLWNQRWVTYRPNARLQLTVGGEAYDVRINSLGYRSREFTAVKPAGTLRVACIGGSTTVQGRTNEDTYPARLEAKLHALRPELSLEVVNLGISGARSDYWLSRTDELFRFSPDIVVQYEGVNDICWRCLPAWADAHPLKRHLRRSLLFERLVPLDPSGFDACLQRTIGNLAQMAERSAQHGARYVVGSFAGPDGPRARPELAAQLDSNLRGWGGPDLTLDRYADYAVILERFNALLAAAARGAHPALGADARLVRVDRELNDPDLFIDICHMTPEGIDRLAAAFVPVVNASLDRPRGGDTEKAALSGGRPSE